MTVDSLNRKSARDLGQMARKAGVDGWHSMRKDQLVKALVRVAARKKRPVSAAKPVARSVVAAARRPSTNGHSTNGHAANGHATKHVNGVVKPASAVIKVVKPKPPKELSPAEKRRHARVVDRLQKSRSMHDRLKDLAENAAPGKRAVTRDRLVVMVRDPFWLHAYWELTRRGVERAQAAMGQEWHSARPILRIYEVSSDGVTSSAEKAVRDIAIHGGVNNWYIDVQEPPRSFRVDIGYLSASGKYFVLARSNIVTTPKAASADVIDENWTPVAEDFEKVYAMSGGYSEDTRSVELQELFEERLRRPMGSPLSTRFGAGADGLLSKKREFSFELDAELIVFGLTEPNAHVTLQGDPVKVRPDGTFTVRFSLPNCRQVIPAVACSADGFEQRTIVLAVERNTKTMEPLVRDGAE